MIMRALCEHEPALQNPKLKLKSISPQYNLESLPGPSLSPYLSPYYKEYY
jgi:hypothetical protein